MSTPKHTPGPWVADWWFHEPTGQGGWSFSAGGFRLPLCDMEMDPAKEDEPEANARLIAAAPELLEALKCCIPFMKYPRGASDLFVRIHDAAIAKARAVIAKAEGDES